jgi:hypothetical protein
MRPAENLTTTGLGSCHHIRHDYADWFLLPKGHAIDAPEFVANQLFWFDDGAKALVSIIDRRYAFEGDA